MAKIVCKCGAVISDNTDYQPWKGYFFAEQDEEVIREIQSNDVYHDDLQHYYREIFQCDQCGRILIENKGKFLSFRPEQSNIPKNILNSADGEKYKSCLRGHWVTEKKKGEIYCGGNSKYACFDIFTSKKNVEEKYFELFEILKNEDLLTDAFLMIDYIEKHKWSLKGPS